MCYTFFLSFSFSSKTIFLYLFYSNFWSRQLSRYLYTQIYVDVLSWSNVKITLVLFSSQDKCVCEEDTCWKHQYIDRYWLIRERWAVSLMSTPLRNLSRQTAKYLETKFIRMMIIWSTGDLYEKKSSMNVNWIRCVYTFRLFFFSNIFDANKSTMVESSNLTFETKEEYLVHCFHTVSLMEQ